MAVGYIHHIFFSFTLPTFLHTGGTKTPAFRKVTKKQTRFRERTSRPSGHRRSRRIYRGSATPGW